MTLLDDRISAEPAAQVVTLKGWMTRETAATWWANKNFPGLPVRVEK